MLVVLVIIQSASAHEDISRELSIASSNADVLGEIDSNDSIENNESDEYYYCECCGRRHLTEDEGGWVDEQWWCNDCIADNAAICSRCGELHNIEDMYYNEEEGYTCRDCMEE